ncbi:MAG TPA: SRPBCC family protein [Gemmatimonadales bacterium]|nr:SRPBCC family protein [Gemmatimonadales bacterium]
MTKSFLGGLTAGAGLVYLLDPEHGQTRRERLAKRLRPVLEGATHALERGAGSLIQPSPGYGARVGDLEGLEEATLRSREREPSAAGGSETAFRVAGGLLALYALTRRGKLASLLRMMGTGFLVRTARRSGPASGGVAPMDRRRAVDIQKTLYIDAPVDQVYAFWSNYANFPLFMSHVREVEDLGGGRSRWSVSGPGGVTIEWRAMLTQQAPDQVIAWRSESGSMLENAGIVRFIPAGAGTRVNLRFCYLPPAGGAGQAVAELLGSDPRAKLNEDLGRMKALLEATTRSELHGKESQS